MAVLITEKLGAVGAAVADVDAERIATDADLPGAVLEALEEHGAIVFRDLHLDDAQQVAFSKQLGSVETFRGADPPEIFRVTLDPKKNPAAQYLRGTFDWHIDGCTDDIPIKATILSAHAVAGSGGETEFASSYEAYDLLDDEEKAHVESLKVVHTIEASQRLFNNEPTEEQLALWRSRPAKVHPLVWRHADGRKSLVIGATASHIEGMDPEESKALLADLLERSTHADRIYRHEWSVGDLVIWDNNGVLHRACRYDPASPRDMHRCTLAGDEPIQ
jgi:alpha-ketoglutarate-dependent taurine dioxygenase